MITVFFLSQYADRTYPLLILGSLMFIPGFYHVRIAYYAWKGYRGYSFEDIPDFDWLQLCNNMDSSLLQVQKLAWTGTCIRYAHYFMLWNHWRIKVKRDWLWLFHHYLDNGCVKHAVHTFTHSREVSVIERSYSWGNRPELTCRWQSIAAGKMTSLRIQSKDANVCTVEPHYFKHSRELGNSLK